MIAPTLLQVLGILAVIAIVLILFLRPGSMFAAVLAVAVVVAAIIVSWRDVEQYRHHRAVAEASQQAIAAATAAATAANAPHTGS
jgi:hypothetical protein